MVTTVMKPSQAPSTTIRGGRSAAPNTAMKGGGFIDAYATPAVFKNGGKLAAPTATPLIRTVKRGETVLSMNGSPLAFEANTVQVTTSIYQILNLFLLTRNAKMLCSRFLLLIRAA